MIAALLGRFRFYIAAAAAFIATLAATWLGGRKSAKTDAKIKAAKDALATHERINNAPITGSPDDARAWLADHARRGKLRDGRKP